MNDEPDIYDVIAEKLGVFEIHSKCTWFEATHIEVGSDKTEKRLEKIIKLYKRYTKNHWDEYARDKIKHKLTVNISRF